MNETEFQERFGSERQCVEALARWKWSDGFLMFQVRPYGVPSIVFSRIATVQTVPSSEFGYVGNLDAQHETADCQVVSRIVLAGDSGIDGSCGQDFRRAWHFPQRGWPYAKQARTTDK